MGQNCRCCGAGLEYVFADLRSAPLSNSYIALDRTDDVETSYPLIPLVCSDCLLVQLPVMATAESIFTDYAYFSSYSDSWVEHARRYTEAMIERFDFGQESLVIEAASNDGYLLQHFIAADVPVLGIEPAVNVAKVAAEHGIPTRVQFFGSEVARSLVEDGIRADLFIGNNVLAQVPPLNDFVEGISIILAPGGVVTVEFPHLYHLMRQTEFDTIYHEHYSYFSFQVIVRLFGQHGLTVFDVEELPTHGGSLRVFARHDADQSKPVSDRVYEMLKFEKEEGFDRLETYLSFDEQIRETKRSFWEFVIKAKRAGKHIVGYGAPSKGNTFLNYCGAGTDVLDYTVDRSPVKQGHLLPGSRIPIHAPEKIFETQPDYVLILPWNLTDEITEQMAGIREWGGKFVVAIPRTVVLD